MAQRLRAVVALTKDSVRFPALTWWYTVIVTPVPGRPVSSPGLLGTRVSYIHIQLKLFRKYIEERNKLKHLGNFAVNDQYIPYIPFSFKS